MKKYVILFLVLMFSACQGGSDVGQKMNYRHIKLLNFENRSFLVIGVNKNLVIFDLLSYKQVFKKIFKSKITALYCIQNAVYLGTESGTFYRNDFSYKNKESATLATKKIRLLNSKVIGKFKAGIIKIYLANNIPYLYLANNDFLYLNQKGAVIRKRKIKAKTLQINKSGIAFSDFNSKLHFIHHNVKNKSYVVGNVLGYRLLADSIFFSDFKGSVYSIYLDGSENERVENFNTPYRDPMSKLFVSGDGQYLFAITKMKKDKSLFMSYDLLLGKIFYQPINGIIEDIVSYHNNRYIVFLLKESVKIRGFQAEKKVIVKTIDLSLL